MKTVKISACQLKVKPVNSFSEFSEQVYQMVNKVPLDADYLLFPELLTVGLLNSFPNSTDFTDKDLTRIAEYTDDYILLFSNIAKQRKQVIIAGSHLERFDNQYYNTCYIFKEDGSYVTHSKTHIFPAEANWDTKEGNELEVFEIGPAKIGIAICYESEIPEVSRILSLKGAEIIFCPSFTFSEHGFWRVRHCAQARCIENQVYFVHCPTVGDSGLVPEGYGRAAIMTPCDNPWNPNGVVVEAIMNEDQVITGEVDIDELYVNREKGAATTFNDRSRREDLYNKYSPYKAKTKV
ncbi:carbon-nitrogen hydrolase family protein [Neobacillus drentensis]|uniref:carbon-nitrogen hydrolase family protein n=1 Tax=Neobacillus drentensis TaxID=220684 RepID=UPI002FFE9B0D